MSKFLFSVIVLIMIKVGINTLFLVPGDVGAFADGPAVSEGLAQCGL